MVRDLRAVFFDAGNTLLIPRVEDVAQDLIAQGFAAAAEDFYVAEREGKARLDDWLWPQIRQGVVPRAIDFYYWREYLDALMERVRVPESERSRVSARVAGRFGDIKTWSHVVPGTAGILQALKGEGYFLGVISNSAGMIEEQLRRADLVQHFNTVIDSAIVGVEKPHPEIFQIALGRAGVEAREALFVGDTYATDVGGAQLAGLRGVLIDWVGAYPSADCPRIKSLAELIPLVRSWRGSSKAPPGERAKNAADKD